MGQADMDHEKVSWERHDLAFEGTMHDSPKLKRENVLESYVSRPKTSIRLSNIYVRQINTR